jgi:MYXO-CTERM domain-containing protein
MPAASAHDELVATTPVEDATVPAPPTTVTLQFGQAVQALGAQVLVEGPDGGAASRGDAEVRDATVVQPVADVVPAGVYRVAWRVIASDGHPLTGEFTFTVAEAPGAVAEEPADGGRDAAVREAATAQPAGSSPPYGPIAAGAVLLAVAGGLVLLRRRT